MIKWTIPNPTYKASIHYQLPNPSSPLAFPMFGLNTTINIYECKISISGKCYAFFLQYLQTNVWPLLKCLNSHNSCTFLDPYLSQYLLLTSINFKHYLVTLSGKENTLDVSTMSFFLKHKSVWGQDYVDLKDYYYASLLAKSKPWFMPHSQSKWRDLEDLQVPGCTLYDWLISTLQLCNKVKSLSPTILVSLSAFHHLGVHLL